MRVPTPPPQDFLLNDKRAEGRGHPYNFHVYEQIDKNIGSGGNKLYLIQGLLDKLHWAHIVVWVIFSLGRIGHFKELVTQHSDFRNPRNRAMVSTLAY